MGPVTRGLLLLFGLALLLCLLAGQSTAQVTDVYLGDRDCNRNDTVLLGGPPIKFVALVQGEVLGFNIVTDSDLVDSRFGSGGGMDRIEGGCRLYWTFPMVGGAPPGSHEFSFTFDYTLTTNESYRHVYNLTANLVQAIELVDAHITSGAPRALVLEVRIHIHCDFIEIEYDSDGRIQTVEESESREGLEPGTYVFSTRLERPISVSGSDADEVGYQITAVFGAETIEIDRMNIDPNELMRDEGISPALVVAVISVIVLSVLLTVIIRRRRRLDAHRARPAVGPGLNPPS